VVTCEALDRIAGARLYFKCENFQKVGAFKYRGASNAIRLLDEDELRRGVVTHSSGNHGQAIALAARQRGATAHIVMPSTSPDVKVKSVEEYGGQVIFCENLLEDRERAIAKLREETGAVEIHPYDDGRVIAGQGTVALELVEQVSDLDSVIAPVGGGGLLAGTVIAVRALRPDIKVFGAEPELADDAFESLKRGERLPQRPPVTIADGLRTALGVLNFEILRESVDGILLASDDEILAAMRLIWERAKLVVEPSAAVPLAALLRDSQRVTGKKVGVVLSGGNIDLCRNSLCHFWKE
jgi:threonine dehydratase